VRQGPTPCHGARAPRQVYTACGEGSTGCVVAATAGCAPEPLFETEPAYAGVTGMWSLPARLGDAQTALVVLAFASASRALTAGARPAGRAPPPPGPRIIPKEGCRTRKLLRRRARGRCRQPGPEAALRPCPRWGGAHATVLLGRHAAPAGPTCTRGLAKAGRSERFQAHGCAPAHDREAAPRRAGTSLADATEVVGLAADERTLAAGLAADLVAVQACTLP